MAKDKSAPCANSLTDEQIRSALQDLNDTVTKFALDVTVFERVLLKKGYLTKADLAATIAEIQAEAKAAIAKVHGTLSERRGGTVQ